MSSLLHLKWLNTKTDKGNFSLLNIPSIFTSNHQYIVFLEDIWITDLKRKPTEYLGENFSFINYIFHLKRQYAKKNTKNYNV